MINIGTCVAALSIFPAVYV